MTQDWVCEKELYISNGLAARKMWEVLAGFVFARDMYVLMMIDDGWHCWQVANLVIQINNSLSS